MAKRALEAQIRFDHNNGSMFIRVSKPHIGARFSADSQVTESGSQSQVNSDGETIVGPRQYKTPKTMSGGERSFTTVSLLLAMWDLSSSPMRCLDEWDVFLDPANRSVAAQMLVGHDFPCCFFPGRKEGLMV
jgi:DNA repair exonuclease SbcCD ATPase subunit